MFGNKLKIGSRDSALALKQSYWVRDKILAKHPELKIEIIEIKTQGDKILDQALAKIGDKGLFTKELEHELLAANIDLAVHSAKDLPTTLPDGLEIAAISAREAVEDVVCFSANFQGTCQLQDARVVATSSLRRLAQLKHHYPHLEFTDIRGNLQTRFNKLDDPANKIDAMILAAAGIKRLGLEERVSELLDPEMILPAVGQGALAIEIASERLELREFLQATISSEIDQKIVTVERAFLRELDGGCQVPIGVYSQVDSGSLKLTGMVASLDGKKILRETITGDFDVELGISLANKLLDQGAKELLASARFV